MNPELRKEILDLYIEIWFYHRLLFSIHYHSWTQFSNPTWIWRPFKHQISVKVQCKVVKTQQVYICNNIVNW